MPEHHVHLAHGARVAHAAPCRRAFRAVGSVPGLTKEAHCPERADGAKFPSSYA